MMFKECDHFIRGIDEYNRCYESAHVVDVMFLAKVMYYYDLTLYNLYDECLVKPDFFAICWELTDLQQCHTKVLQGQFFQSLQPCLKAPASLKRSNLSMDEDHGKLLGPPLTKNPKGSYHPNMDHHAVLRLKNGKDFNDVVLRTQQMKLVPDLPGTNTIVCVNWHVNERCHDICERKASHKMLPSVALQKMEAFLKACRIAQESGQATYLDQQHTPALQECLKLRKLAEHQSKTSSMPT